eukprot:TRINITY_DN4442_c0_g1_i3.p1 TRINITY_DN4442_c0_g1~~TRINITY_DN4442_c0_g1_i3.p1  ORF type:complete len:299 (+),score=44.35 TRINITY_DN4442_c0_g1_i3:155-1051(+)
MKKQPITKTDIQSVLKPIETTESEKKVEVKADPNLLDRMCPVSEFGNSAENSCSSNDLGQIVQISSKLVQKMTKATINNHLRKYFTITEAFARRVNVKALKEIQNKNYDNKLSSDRILADMYLYRVAVQKISKERQRCINEVLARYYKLLCKSCRASKVRSPERFAILSLCSSFTKSCFRMVDGEVKTDKYDYLDDILTKYNPQLYDVNNSAKFKAYLAPVDLGDASCTNEESCERMCTSIFSEGKYDILYNLDKIPFNIQALTKLATIADTLDPRDRGGQGLLAGKSGKGKVSAKEN